MDVKNIPHVVGYELEASVLADRTFNQSIIVYTDLELDCFAANFDSSILNDLLDEVYAFLREKKVSFDLITLRRQNQMARN